MEYCDNLDGTKKKYLKRKICFMNRTEAVRLGRLCLPLRFGSNGLEEIARIDQDGYLSGR